MLVLQRRREEGIVIKVGSERIVVRICDCHLGRVKVGIEGSRAVSVVREEIEHVPSRNKPKD